MSFPRRRESRKYNELWIPALRFAAAGMTDRHGPSKIPPRGRGPGFSRLNKLKPIHHLRSITWEPFRTIPPVMAIKLLIINILNVPKISKK